MWARGILVGLIVVMGGCAAQDRDPAAGEVFSQAQIWQTSALKPIRQDRLVADLARADIVILGEVHDNPVHHQIQAHLINALAPGGVAYEMIPEKSEEGIAVFRAQGGADDAIGPAIGWDRMGWPQWEQYRPLFRASTPRYIAGGALTHEEIGRAMFYGAVTANTHTAFEGILKTPLSTLAKNTMTQEMITAHCGLLPANLAPQMIEAQRLRDTSFAAAALRAWERGGNGRAVLITGNGHARKDRGVPSYLHAIAPGLKVLSLGILERGAQTSDLAYAPYDFVWITQPALREDPCAGFSQTQTPQTPEPIK